MTEELSLGYRTSTRAFRVAMGVSCALLLLGIGGLIRQLTTPGYDFGVAFRSGEYTVRLAKDDSASTEQLREGDRIVAVDGTAIRDELQGIYLFQSSPPGSEHRLTVRRDGRARDVVIRSAWQRPLIRPRWVVDVILFVFSWVVIVMIAVRRPRDPVAILTALAGGTGLLAVAIDNTTHGYGNPLSFLAWTTIWGLAVALEGALFLHWTLCYPIRHTVPRRVFAFIYGPPLAAGITVVTLAATHMKGAPVDALIASLGVLHLISATLTLLAMANLVRTYFRVLGRTQRMQVKWLVIAVCVGLLPEVVFMVHRALNMADPFPGFVAHSFILAIPLGFLASIFRFRLFDVDLIASRTQIIGILLFAVVIARSLASNITLPPQMNHPAAPWAASLFLVGVPALTFWRQLDRPLGIPGVKPQAVRRSVQQALSIGGSMQGLVRRFLEATCESLDLERAAVFLRDPLANRFVCNHAVRCFHLETEHLTAEGKGGLVGWLKGRTTALRTRAHNHPLELDLLAPDERRLLESLDTAAIVPIIVGTDLRGFLTISAHRSGNLPNTPLLRLLEGVTGELASAPQLAMSERSTLPIDETGPPTATRENGLAVVAPDGVGDHVGPYLLVKRLGRGTAGEVWVARHRSGREVALKIMHRELGRNPKALKRIRDEIDILAQIDDPYVVRVLDCGNWQGVPWFAMELVRGETLAARMARHGSLQYDDALRVAAKLAYGLAACHAVGVVHRDLSPGNVMLAGPAVKIVDLGLAHRIAPEDRSLGRTQTTVAGTILYMSPEQIRGERVSPASDLFSLGAITYECLTGKAAFLGESLSESIEKVRDATFAPLAPLVPELSEEAIDLVTTLLSRDPDHRPASAKWVGKLLDRFARQQAAVLRRGA